MGLIKEGDPAWRLVVATEHHGEEPRNALGDMDFSRGNAAGP